jgi:hypothetical protein
VQIVSNYGLASVGGSIQTETLPLAFPLDGVLYLFYGACMDWAFAIERNREPLRRIVAALFAMIGLTENGAVERLSRPLYRAVLGVLRPAEAAVRRLIVVAARAMVVKPRQHRPAPAGLTISGKGQGRVSFQLFDPRQPFDTAYSRRDMGRKSEPRIRFIDMAFDPRIALFRQPRPAPAPQVDESVADDTVNAGPLCRRLAAIRCALEDLPRQARRLARWRARPIEARRPRLSTPLRLGSPPGHRKRQTHEVDEILNECHWLARNGPEPGTS